MQRRRKWLARSMASSAWSRNCRRASRRRRRTFSDLYKLCIKRCEDFHKVETLGSEPGVLNFAKKTLRGAEAVKHTFDEVRRMMASSPDSVTLHTLRPLKTFAWVLTPSEQQTLREWVSAAIARKAPSCHLAIADSASATPGANLVVQAPSASVQGHASSSSGGAQADILQAKLGPNFGAAGPKQGSETGEATKAMVMQFFYKKGAA